MKRNGIEEEFSDFVEAKNAFKESIINAISDEDAYCDGEPFSLCRYFSGKYDNGSISDEEIIIETRARTILEYLLCLRDSVEMKSKILKLISKNYSYHGVDEFGVEVSLSIARNLDEITFHLVVDDNGDINLLEANSFVMDDDEKEYYFVAKETITTSNDSNKLGKTISSNITLSKVKRGKTI